MTNDDRRRAGGFPPRDAVLAVVIVTFNSGDVIDACLQSLQAAISLLASARPVSPRVVVIDNASASKPDNPTIDDLVVLPRNVGFSVAANVGISRVANATHVLLLNPDARLDSDALVRLFEVFDDPRVAIAGPMLIGEKGETRPSERPFHSVRRELRRQLTPWRAGFDDLNPGEPRCLTGACLLVDGEFLNDIGGLDESLRMYLEDVELCWRAQAEGRLVRFVPQARCRHDLGGSSQGVDFRGSIGLHLTLLSARVEFVRRRSGVLGALGMRSAIAAGALSRAVFAPTNGRRFHFQVCAWAVTSGRGPAWEAIAG